MRLPLSIGLVSQAFSFSSTTWPPTARTLPRKRFFVKYLMALPRTQSTRYHRELLFLDTHLSRLIERLQQHPSWDEMLLVITSDHGEAFGEHDLVGHSSSLYDVMIRVPLILKLPRDTGLQDAPVVGTRWSRSMQLVDIAPVVLAHAGVDGSMDMDGRGLDADPSILRAWSYPSMALRGADDRYRRELRSIEEGEWKLIEDDRGTVELYDLQSDPGKRRTSHRATGRASKPCEQRLGPAARRHPGIGLLWNCRRRVLNGSAPLATSGRSSSETHPRRLSATI